MENEKDIYQEPSHYTSSVGVEFSYIQDFRFLVPKHLVDEMDICNQSYEIKIREWIEHRRPSLEDCEGHSHSSQMFITDSITVENQPTKGEMDNLVTCEVS